MDGGRGLIIFSQTQSHVTWSDNWRYNGAHRDTEPLVLLGEVTPLQHDHQELRVRGHEDLVTGGPGPEEGHLVGRVQVPDHGLGSERQVGHEVLILRQGKSLNTSWHDHTIPGPRWCCPQWSWWGSPLACRASPRGCRHCPGSSWSCPPSSWTAPGPRYCFCPLDKSTTMNSWSILLFLYSLDWFHPAP